MAQDLAEASMSLVEIQNAGQWKSPATPAYYTRAQNTRCGVVAKYYESNNNEN